MQVIRPADEQIPLGPVAVTGGARGIGLEAGRLVARAGADVALIDRDADALEQAAATLSADTGARAVPITCDVSDEAQVEAAFERVGDDIGPPHGVVAAAGIDRGAPPHELDAETWDEVLAINLRGTFLTCRAALRAMLELGGGSIVCLSSPFAVASAPGGTAAYSASKGGVSALVRALAVDYGPHRIRVNAVVPGPTETELMWAGVPERQVPEMREAVSREVPLGRLADPAEPARAIVWLLSDASSYVTGAQLACDGGVLAKASVSV